MSTTTVSLKSGAQMPLVGLGTWKAEKGVTAKVVEDAIRSGYRLLDCACDYGNEVEVGAGIKAAIDAGVCTREDLFVTSKLWNTYHAKEHVPMALKKTLADLGLDYVDLYLIHFPISQEFVPFEVRYPPEWTEAGPPAPDAVKLADVPVRETWEAMEEVASAGLAKSIGVSNFNCQALMDLKKYAKVPVSVLQIEHHPFLVQPGLIKYCHAQGIAITAYSSFGPSSYFQLGHKGESLIDQPLLKPIAEKYKKSVPQVLLRWAVQRNIAVIPKTSNKDRLVENANIFDFTLSEEDIAAISSLDRNQRFNNPGMYANIPIFD